MRQIINTLLYCSAVLKEIYVEPESLKLMKKRGRGTTKKDEKETTEGVWDGYVDQGDRPRLGWNGERAIAERVRYIWPPSLSRVNLNPSNHMVLVQYN